MIRGVAHPPDGVGAGAGAGRWVRRLRRCVDARMRERGNARSCLPAKGLAREFDPGPSVSCQATALELGIIDEAHLGGCWSAVETKDVICPPVVF